MEGSLSYGSPGNANILMTFSTASLRRPWQWSHVENTERHNVTPRNFSMLCCSAQGLKADCVDVKRFRGHTAGTNPRRTRSLHLNIQGKGMDAIAQSLSTVSYFHRAIGSYWRSIHSLPSNLARFDSTNTENKVLHYLRS